MTKLNTLSLNAENKDKFSKNYVVVYHSNCSDGIFSAVATLLGMYHDTKPPVYAFPSDGLIEAFPAITFVELGYYDVLDIFDIIDEDTDLYFVDISIKDMDMINALCAKVNSVISLDHHDDTVEFAIQNAHQLPANFVNMNSTVRSGAWLAWDYFCWEKDQPIAIQWVDDRDRWVFSLNETVPFHEYVVGNVLAQPNIRLRMEEAIKLLDARSAFVAVDRGAQVVKYRNALINPLIQDLNVVDIHHNGNDLRCAVITAPYQLISESCSQLLERHSSVDLVCAVFLGTDGVYNYSFRCRKRDQDKIRVNDLATKLGGGGHKAASGASNLGTFDLLQAMRGKSILIEK